jgi:hypothetical protein
MNDPVFLPEARIEELEKFGFFEQLTKPGSEENGKRRDVNEEVGPRPDPLSLGRKPAAGSDVMNMGMIKEIASPGMKDADQADLAADESWVGGKIE